MGLYVPGSTQGQWTKLMGKGIKIIDTPNPTERVLPGAYGTFMANSPAYSGLKPGWTPAMLTPVYGNSSGVVSITGPGPYVNKLFWGRLNMQSPIKPTFINCAVAGKPPSLYTTLDGCIKCYGDGYYQWEMLDCLIDGGLWLEPSLNASRGSSPVDLQLWRSKMGYSAGVHGGRGIMRNTEIKRVADSWNSVQKRNTQSPNAYTLIEGGWWHANAYYFGPDWTATTDGSHSDGFQFNVGPNTTIRGLYIGGVRDEYGYGLYNPANTSSPPSYNSGDDPWNAGMMIKQEVSMVEENLLQNILVEDVFFEGGTYNINHVYLASRPNTFDTMVIRNTKHVRRANGKYIIADDQVLHCYDNPRVIDKNPSAPNGYTVGELVTIARG